LGRAAGLGVLGEQPGRLVGGRLDVVGLVAEALEAEQVVDGLPDHARDRVPAHDPEQDDLPARPPAHVGVSPPAAAAAASSRDEPRRAPTCTSWSCRYSPPRASSSSWVPCSTSWPWLSTRIRSAWRTVD